MPLGLVSATAITQRSTSTTPATEGSVRRRLLQLTLFALLLGGFSTLFQPMSNLLSSPPHWSPDVPTPVLSPAGVTEGSAQADTSPPLSHTYTPWLRDEGMGLRAARQLAQQVSDGKDMPQSWCVRHQVSFPPDFRLPQGGSLKYPESWDRSMRCCLDRPFGCICPAWLGPSDESLLDASKSLYHVQCTPTSPPFQVP